MSSAPLPGSSHPRHLYKAPIFRCPIPGCQKVCHTSRGVKLHIGAKHARPASLLSVVQSQAVPIPSPNLPFPNLPNLQDANHDKRDANEGFFGGEDMHINAANTGPPPHTTPKVTVTTHPQLDGMTIRVWFVSYFTNTRMNVILFRYTSQ